MEDALYKMGAREGAEVTIGEITFEWEPLTTAGVSESGSPATARGTDVRIGRSTRSTAAERKRASQARRGLIDEFDFGDEEASRDRWEG